MAQTKNTTNLTSMLFQFIDTPDPMLSMLEWLCEQMMEAEVSNEIGADKHQQSQSRTGLAAVFVRAGWIPGQALCI